MLEESFEKIERESIAEKVAQSLRSKILAGDLAPGTRLIEAQLANQLGVSRAPVREAFLRLEHEGLVSTESGKGTYVSQMSLDDFEEISTLRCVLEGLAMRLAFQHISEADRLRLAGLVAGMKQAADQGDIERLLALDMRFHSTIWQISGHKRLLELLTNMTGPIRLFQVTNLRLYENLVENVLEHELLLGALSRSSAEAEALMVRHIQEAAEMTLPHLRQRQVSEK